MRKGETRALMWDKLILQAFVSLLPIFVYQLWMYRINHERKSAAYFCAAYGLSLAGCFALSIRTEYGFDLDLRLLPLFLGSLYGGYPAVAVLSVIYGGLQIPILDSPYETISFILFIGLFIPIILLTVRPFQRARMKDKLRITFILLALAFLYYAGTYIGYLRAYEPDGLKSGLATLAGIACIYGIVTALTLYTISSVVEHHQLQIQLRRMSSNYMNEVHKLQQFVDQMSMGTVIVDRDGRLSHLNDAAIRFSGQAMKGRDKLEFAGIGYESFFRDHDSCRSLFDSALNGTPVPSQIHQESDRVYLLTAFPILDLQAGDAAGAAMMIQDISELDQLRNELSKMERLSLVGQMAASITHEIRNPMAVIRGFVQLMRERSPDSQQEYFRIIIEELDRANSIINDFLSLAQNRVIAKEVGSLHHVINEILPLLWADANLRGQSIELDFAETIPLLELNDKEIKQLILNLARNGMEAMGEKGVLTLSTRQSGGSIELRVEDTGEGIPEDKREQLFEPFYTTKARGTGLGLPLCLSIAERHNGRIEVHSVPGQGTSFIITFEVPDSIHSGGATA